MPAKNGDFNPNMADLIVLSQTAGNYRLWAQELKDLPKAPYDKWHPGSETHSEFIARQEREKRQAAQKRQKKRQSVRAVAA